MPLSSGDKIALDTAFNRMLQEAGIPNGLPFLLSVAIDQAANLVSAGAIGSTPNATGLTITDQAISLQPASLTTPGAVSTVAQVFGGLKDLAGGAITSSAAISSIASGTGITTVVNGGLRRGCIKITVTSAAWIAAGLTQNLILGVIPAKSRIVGVIADTTQAYTLGTDTILMSVGITGTLDGYIDVHDVKTSTIVMGLIDDDLGSLLETTALIQGGHMPSWTATTNLTVSLSSSLTNLGNGSTTSLTTGSTTFYITIENLA